MMGRNGTFFFSVIEPDSLIPSFWDPYLYRTNGEGETLADYATVSKPSRASSTVRQAPFRPIEYSDIPKGNFLTFVLESSNNGSSKWPMVGEQELLMGTMRAYLGNIVVTPQAEWLNLESPLFFPIKSEFIRITPKDGCNYFWWAFLQSASFLKNLPTGSGGTRPRLHEEALLLTPIEIPNVRTRTEIHKKLKECAEHDWKQSIRRTSILNLLGL